MSFGPRQQTQSTTFELSPEQRALIQPAVEAGIEFAANPPQLPDYSQVAPFNPSQLAAQESLLGAVLPQQELAEAAAGANQFLLGDVLYPETNPALQRTIEASTRPITDDLLERVLPGIRGGAVTAGQFGGSRQGIAEGLATGRAAQAVGDTAARVASAGYDAGLEALTRGLGLAPTTLQGLTAPGLTTGAVGDVRRALEQAQLSERASRDLYEQTAPFLAAREVAALGAGLPGGTTTSTATLPGQNPLSAALGIGSLAAGLFGGGGTALPAYISPQAAGAIFGQSGLF